jgi:hypothetical protein
MTFIRVQNMNPRPSPSPKHGRMPTRVTALSFDFCVLYHIPCALSFLSSKNSGKEGDSKSTYNKSVAVGQYRLQLKTSFERNHVACC